MANLFVQLEKMNNSQFMNEYFAPILNAGISKLLDK
jgi:hypothetical protein